MPKSPPTKSSNPTTPFRTTTSTANNTSSSYPFPLTTSEETTTAHFSPTKALHQTRLQNDLTTLQTWLQSLFQPHPIPAPLLLWRNEVLSSSSSSSSSLNYHTTTPLITSPPLLSPDFGAVSKPNDVLEALKALRQANLLADHLRGLVHEARVEERCNWNGGQEFINDQRSEGQLARQVIDEIYAGLSREGRVAIEGLVEGGVMLGLFGVRGGGDLEAGTACSGRDEDPETAGLNLVEVFASRIFDQAHRNSLLDEQGRELELLQELISARQAELEVPHHHDNNRGRRREGLNARNFPDDTTDGYEVTEQEDAEQIHAQTAMFNRDTKQINLKILEYQDRVAALRGHLAACRADSVSLEDVLEARRRVQQQSARVRELEARITTFHGLPPDLSASREEVKRTMNELADMKRKREELFGRISSVER